MKMSGLVSRVGLSLLSDKTLNIFLNNASKEKRQEKSWIKNAQRLAETLGELKGGVMKIGQMISLQEGLFPKEFTQILGMLQKEAPPVAFETLLQVVEQDLPEYKKVIASIEPQAFASASIGQVHIAHLHDGTKAALKIQYPNMDKVIESDLKNLKSLFKLLGSMFLKMDMEAVWDEVRTQLSREVDYKLEAENQEIFRKLFKDSDLVIIPRVIPEASSRHVLCTVFHQGESIEKVLHTPHSKHTHAHHTPLTPYMTH